MSEKLDPEVMEIIRKNLKLKENAKIILKNRYLRKNEKQEVIETPEEMFHRVVSHIAKAEDNYKSSAKFKEKVKKAFAEVLSKLEFLPNSPTFTGAGTVLGQLAACFVLPIEDDMHSIMETLKHTVLIHKSGGGTGFSFSRLRPEGSPVASSGGVASGPVSFMRMYNATTEEIKQGGTRRGANMGILRIDHPDILKFIECKKENQSLNNFNISVAVTDDFMEKVEKNKKYALIDPRTQKIVKKLNARKVFKKIVYGAWKNGEPGIVFIDKINAKNPTPEIGEIESTNPCGEQPLLPYESCNLGSINLSKFVKKGKIDWQRLEYVVRVAVRFLDNVIDMNKFPLPEIEKQTKANRKIGLGVMGFADMLIKLGVPYNSTKALKIGEKVMKFIQSKAKEASQKLAKQRGAFPNFKKSIYYQRREKPLRNATLTTIAPTGTISMIAGTSSGIEPLFAIVYVKNVLDNKKLLEINPLFEKIAKKEGFYSKKIMEKISETGMLNGIKGVPKKIKTIFVTSREIEPEWHVKMQAAFQKYVDNAVSKTINFPNEASKKDIEKAYFLAWKLNLKGITVYRDGSREEQVIDFGKKKEEEQKTTSLPALSPKERPEIMQGYTYKVKTSYGNMYITINEDKKGQPFEVFTQIGKAGGFFHANTEAISRLISLALRSGIEIKEVVEQLEGIRDPSPAWTENGLILSLPDAIANVLKRHLSQKQQTLTLDFENKKEAKNSPALVKKENPETKQPSLADIGEAPICPECGHTLVFQEGCFKCPICGFSKCSG